MKRFIPLLLAVAVMILCAACAPKSNASLQEVINDLNTSSADDISSFNTSSDDSPIDITVEDAVVSEYKKVGTYVCGNQKVDYSYEYPKITVKTFDVNQINNKIRQYCEALINTELKAMRNEQFIQMTKMGYTACVKNNVLSVTMRMNFEADQLKYTIYNAFNINLRTGAELDKNEVLNAAGYTSTDGEAKIKAAAQNKFTELYGNEYDYDGEELEAYNKALESTLVDYDVDMTLFFDGDEILTAVVRVYNPEDENLSYNYEVKVE